MLSKRAVVATALAILTRRPAPAVVTRQLDPDTTLGQGPPSRR